MSSEKTPSRDSRNLCRDDMVLYDQKMASSLLKNHNASEEKVVHNMLKVSFILKIVILLLNSYLIVLSNSLISSKEVLIDGKSSYLSISLRTVTKVLKSEHIYKKNFLGCLREKCLTKDNCSTEFPFSDIKDFYSFDCEILSDIKVASFTVTFH